MKKSKRKPLKINRTKLHDIEQWAQASEIRNITRPKDEVELMKFNICNEFCGFMRRNKVKQVEMVKILGETKSLVSEIVNFKLKGKGLGRLMGLLKILAEKDEVTNQYYENINAAYNINPTKQHLVIHMELIEKLKQTENDELIAQMYSKYSEELLTA